MWERYMKKIIIILSIFIISGCSLNVRNNTLDNIDSEISNVISYNVPRTNAYYKGYSFYKPRDFSVIENNEFNSTLVHNENKYYLNIDINAYLNKHNIKSENNESLYFYKVINNNDKNGYIKITEGKNSYFYLKMLYNYSYIEASLKEEELYESVLNSLVILSSIKYNDKVIVSLIDENSISGKSVPYELKGPVIKKDNKSILDVYDYSIES